MAPTQKATGTNRVPTRRPVPPINEPERQPESSTDGQDETENQVALFQTADDRSSPPTDPVAPAEPAAREPVPEQHAVEQPSLDHQSAEQPHSGEPATGEAQVANDEPTLAPKPSRTRKRVAPPSPRTEADTTAEPVNAPLAPPTPVVSAAVAPTPVVPAAVAPTSKAPAAVAPTSKSTRDVAALVARASGRLPSVAPAAEESPAVDATMQEPEPSEPVSVPTAEVRHPDVPTLVAPTQAPTRRAPNEYPPNEAPPNEDAPNVASHVQRMRSDAAPLTPASGTRTSATDQTPESEPSTSARREPRETGRVRLRLQRWHLVVITLALVVLGAVGGALYAQATASYVASAQVDAGPGSTQAQQLAVSGDQANRYVQTEVLYLTDPALGERVQAQLKLPVAPTYAVRQVGNTSVLEVVATDENTDVAANVSNAVVADYVAGWRDRNDRELASQIETVQSQLADVQSKMALFDGDKLTPNEQAQLNSYAAQAQQLQTQLSTLNAQRADVQSDVRIVTEASADLAGPTASPKMLAVLGALLGGLVAVGVWVWAQRRRQ